MVKPFTVVSTFAGGGGSSLGYKLAGGQILLVNEFVPEAVKTYQTNFPDTPIDPNDIRQITEKNKSGVIDWFRSYGIDTQDLDILDGSPPCATFSMASRTAGVDKSERFGAKYSDVKQDRIGELALDFAYLVECSQPKVCVFENVPTIAKSNLFLRVLNHISDSGYVVGFRFINSEDYGTPQSRKRLIMVGVRNDIANEVGIETSDDIVKVLTSPTSTPKKTVQTALNGVVIDTEERELLLSSCLRSVSYEMIRQIPKNPPRPMKLRDAVKGWKGDFNLVRASWDHPSPTITQSGQQIGRSGVHHPSEDRKFTINELKRLQGLPDDFVLTGTFNQRAERIGRMVPPLLMKGVATHINEHILSVRK